MGHMTIIRGVPGSGKTYLAATMIDYAYGDDTIVEANDYFVQQGEYKFDRAHLQDAHTYCKSRVLQCIEEGCDHILVTNTATRIWEYAPYVKMAEDNGYTYTIISCHGRFPNEHGVPENKVKAMIDRWETHDDAKLRDEINKLN